MWDGHPLRLEVLEGLLVLAFAVLAFGSAGGGPLWLRRLDGALSKLAERRRLSVLIVGAAPVLIRLAILDMPKDQRPRPSPSALQSSRGRPT